jgi:WD40 repeat protein
MNTENEILQMPATLGKRLALVAGANQTATHVPPPLQLAVADATAMAEVLQQRCHFELFRPPLLGEHATSAALKKTILQLARDRSPEDIILFFFSGHGIQMYDSLRSEIRTTYLGTADFDTQDAEDDPDLHIPLRWLRDRLFANCNAGQVVIILDCCYAEDIRTGPDRRLADLLNKLADYFDIPGAESGQRQPGLRAALAATGYDQTASEQGKHGNMTNLILQVLRGEVPALLGARGEVFLSRLGDYLIEHLSPDQKPAILTNNSLGRNCILASYPELVSPASLPQSGPDRPTPYIPFPRDPFFQGRAADFVRLEQLLDGTSTPASPTRPGLVGITGMGGIGKTQLAVELVYRLHEQLRYPGGIFWTQVKGTGRSDWEEQFAALAAETEYLPPGDDPASREHKARRARHLLRYLADQRDVLLVLDNVEEPASIMHLLSAIAGRDLSCFLLYTSRTQIAPGTTIHTLGPLSEESALRLLLQSARPSLLTGTPNPMRQAELTASRNICQKVGYLPLALAHLRGVLTRDQSISLARLDEKLRDRGMQAQADQDDVPITTFSLSWEHIRNDEARRLLLLAACVPEAAPVPLWLLGLAAGLGEQTSILTPLGQAHLHLQELSLLEELSEQQVRLHPLVRTFVRAMLKKPELLGEEILAEARQRLVSVCRLSWLEQRARSEGYWKLLERIQLMRMYSDLLVAGEELPRANLLHMLERWLSGESYLLAQKSWWPDRLPWLFYQQLFNRAVETAYVLPASIEGTPPSNWVRQKVSTGVDDRALLRRFADHTGAVSGVAFSSDGHLLLTGSTDSTARIWDRRSGRERCRLHPGALITSVAFSPDGKFVLLGCGDRTVRLWDWEPGQEIARLQGHTNRVRSVAFSPDGQMILSGSADKTARIWDRQTLQELACVRGHSDFVTGVAFSPDGQLIATCSADRTVRLWSRQSWRELLRLQGHTDQILGVAFSPDGQLILTGSADKTARVWNWQQVRELARLQGPTGEIWCVSFSPDGQLVMTGSDDGIVRLWDWKRARELASLKGDTSAVRCLAFAPDGRQALTGSGDGNARLWDWEIAQQCLDPQKHTGSVTSVAFSPRGDYLLTGSQDCSVCLWNWESGRPAHLLRRFQGHTGRITSVTFAPDGQRLLTGSADGTVRLWDKERTHEFSHVRLPEQNDWVQSMAYAPDGLQFLSGTREGYVYLWDHSTLTELARLQGHTERVTCAVYSSDGRYILTGSQDGTVRMWDRNSARELACLPASPGWISSVAFSPDGQRLLACSNDGTASLWDRTTSQEMVNLSAGPTSAIRLSSFSPDGHIVLTCHANGQVFFWRASKPDHGTLLGLYVAHYEVGAIHWIDKRHLCLADIGGSSGRPHIYELILEGMPENGQTDRSMKITPHPLAPKELFSEGL